MAEINEPVVLNHAEAKFVEPARATEQVARELIIAREVDSALESNVEGLKADFVTEGVETASERAEPFSECSETRERQRVGRRNEGEKESV